MFTSTLSTFNGTSSGRVELEVNDDGNGEYGLIHLYSDAQKSIRMEPTSFALRDDANGYRHLVNMNINNDSGNDTSGGYEDFTTINSVVCIR